MSPRRLEVVIAGDASSLERALGKAGQSTHSLAKTAGIAGLAIAGGLAAGLTESVKAAVAAQASQARLDEAFKTAGISAAAAAGQVDQAEASARKLGFTGNDVHLALGSLVTATGSVKTSMADLGVAEDLARFKGIGLTDATKMLTMAQTGSQRAAKQLGINVPPVTAAQDALKASSVDLTTVTGKLELAHAKLQDKMATGQAVTDAVSAKVAGQGDAFAATAAGGMAQMNAQFDFLKEKVGMAVLPALTELAGVLASAASFMSQHTTAVKIGIVALGGLAAVLLTVSVAAKIAAATEAVMSAAQWALNVALDANPIGVVVIALAALAVGLVEAWKHSATFRNIVTGVWNDVRGVVLGAEHAIEGAIGGIIAAFNAVLGPIKDIIHYATLAANAVSSVVGSAIGGVTATLPDGTHATKYGGISNVGVGTVGHRKDGGPVLRGKPRAVLAGASPVLVAVA